MAHDQHDEEYIRTHWWEYGAGGDELHASTTAPKYAPRITMATKAVAIAGRIVVLPLGSFEGSNREARGSSRRTYR